MSNFLGLLIVSAAAPSAEGIQVKTKKMNIASNVGSRLGPVVVASGVLSLQAAYRRAMAEVALKGANRALTTQAGAAAEKVAVEDILPKILPEVSPRTPFIFQTPKTMAMDVMAQSNKDALRSAAQIAKQAKIAEQGPKAFEAASKQEVATLHELQKEQNKMLQTIMKDIGGLTPKQTPKETPKGTLALMWEELTKLVGPGGLTKIVFTVVEIVVFRNTMIRTLEALQNRLPEAKEKFQQQIDELNNHHSAKHLNGLFNYETNFLAGLDKDIALPDYWRIKVQDLKEIIRKQEDILASNSKMFWYTSEEKKELKEEIEERKKQLETAEKNLKQREERLAPVFKLSLALEEMKEDSLFVIKPAVQEFKDEISDAIDALAPLFKSIGKYVR